MNKHIHTGEYAQKEKGKEKKTNPGKLFRAPFPSGFSAKQFNCS